MAELIATIHLVDGSLSLGSARTHSVAVDRPLDKGGSDRGFLGGELLLVAEGGCFLSNLVAAARVREIALHRCQVTVRGVPADAPPRFAEIHVEVDAAADCSGEELDKLLQIAERGCIVSNTLRDGTTLVIRRVDTAN
jgi:putative redox protein